MVRRMVPACRSARKREKCGQHGRPDRRPGITGRRPVSLGFGSRTIRPASACVGYDPTVAWQRTPIKIDCDRWEPQKTRKGTKRKNSILFVSLCAFRGDLLAAFQRLATSPCERHGCRTDDLSVLPIVTSGCYVTGNRWLMPRTIDKQNPRSLVCHLNLRDVRNADLGQRGRRQFRLVN